MTADEYHALRPGDIIKRWRHGKGAVYMVVRVGRHAVMARNTRGQVFRLHISGIDRCALLKKGGA